jgi:Nitrile hydratase, alpha chain
MAAAKGKTSSKKAAPKKKAPKRGKGNLSVWKGVVALAWKDPGFKDRLVNDPGAVLTEHGFKGKKGVAYRVVADSRDTKHLILPQSAKSVRVKGVRGGEVDPGF